MKDSNSKKEPSQTTLSNFEKEPRKDMLPKFRANSLPLVRRILKMLDAGYYPSKIAEILGRSASGIHYHVKKLEKHGFIEPTESIEKLKNGLYVKKTKGIIKLYNLTQAGSNFLAGIDRKTRGRVLRLHNAYWLYPVLRQPGKVIEWRRVEMTNWTQLLGRELGLRVRKNPNSLEIISGVVEGKNPFQMLLKSRDEADHLAAHLEEKFDMVLGRSKMSRRPHYGVYDPIAGAYSQFFQLSDDIAKIDESEGFGEIDFLSPEAAKDYLMMPMKVHKMERDLGEIKEGQRLFSEGMLEHMAMIREVRGLVQTLQKQIEKQEKQQNKRT